MSAFLKRYGRKRTPPILVAVAVLPAFLAYTAHAETTTPSTTTPSTTTPSTTTPSTTTPSTTTPSTTTPSTTTPSTTTPSTTTPSTTTPSTTTPSTTTPSTTTPSTTTPSTTTTDVEASGNLLDKSRTVVTRTINRVARAVDRFFSNSDVYTDTKGNWATLGLGVRIRSDGVKEYTSVVAARLALPNTEKKYNFLVESNQDTTSPTGATDPLSAVTAPVYSGGLRYIVTDSKTWHVHLDAGAEFATPVDAFVRGRVRRNFTWKRTQLRMAETLTEYQSGRQHAVTELVVDHLLARYWLWRNALTVQAAHPLSEAYSVLSSSIFHRIDERHAVQLEVLSHGLDDPPRIHEYQLNLRYRIRSEMRDWVFYEIAPQRRYSEDNGFDPVNSIYFGVELQFRG